MEIMNPKPFATAQPAPPALRITDLSFGYPGQPALFEGFGLEVAAGSRFGLFGPNGAGKTTLMQLMTGLLTASTGSIRIFGQPITHKDRSINRLFGFIPQDFAFYEELSPAENLAFFGAWSGLEDRKSVV